MNSVSSPETRNENQVSFALMKSEHVGVIRVDGRGNFMNSVPVKKLSEHLQTTETVDDIIMDLDTCDTMDSTFMGVLACISMKQIRRGQRKLIVANANEQCRKLLKTLGISNILEVHEDDNGCSALGVADKQMKAVETEKLSHTDQICHTLEAHRVLVQADGENEVRFQSVIHYLEKSLEAES